MPNNSVESWVREFLPDYPITHNADGSIQIPHRKNGEGKEVNIKERTDGKGIILHTFGGIDKQTFLLVNKIDDVDLFYKEHQTLKNIEELKKPARKKTTPKKAKENQAVQFKGSSLKQISAEVKPIETRKEIAKVVSDEIKNNIQLRLIEPKYDNRYLFKNEKDVELYKPDPAELKEISSKLGKLITLEGLIKADATICKKPYSIAFKVNDDKEIRINNNKEKTLYFEGRTDFLTAASLGLDAKYNLVGLFNIGKLQGVELLSSKEHLFIIDADVLPYKITFNDEHLNADYKHTKSVKTLKLNDIDKDCKDFSDYIYKHNITSVKDFESTLHHARTLKAANYFTLNAAEISPLEPVLKFNNQTIGTKGGLSVIFGAAGVGKSSVNESIIANFINSKVDDNRFFGIEVEPDVKRLIYIDTERDLPIFLKSITRAFNKANTIYKPIYNDKGKYFEAIKITDLINIEQSLEILEEIILTKAPDVLILDLISDFSSNTNDIEQSTTLTKRIKLLAEHHRINIICVIHANENEKSGDAARGHLGRELQRKATGVLRVERSKDDKNVSVLSTTKVSIGANTTSYMYFDEDKKMHLECDKPREVSNLELTQRDYFYKVFQKDAKMTYSQLVAAMKKVAKKPEPTIKRWITDASSKGIINSENKLYFFVIDK